MSARIFFENCKSQFRDSVEDIVARYYLQKKKKKNRECMKVCFLVNEPESWDKQASIYEEFLKRENINVDLIIVPVFDARTGIRSEYGEERAFFVNRYGRVIDAVNPEGEVINLQEEEYDYVFYQSPYNIHMPEALKSYNVVKYSKICYIPYGYVGADVFVDVSSNISFFRNVYWGFMESVHSREVMYNKFLYNCKKGIQHFEFYGYPVLEEYLKINFDNKNHRILWTPRWSYDKKTGGSHFLEYREKFSELRVSFPCVELMFRPHPMMFRYLVDEGLMTKMEVDLYQKQLKHKNVLFSQQGLILDVFKKTDILITDFSSIIIMFFLSGNPIIYCNSTIEFNEEYKKLEAGLYIAETWEDVERYLREILNGNDYLKEERKKIIEKEFGVHMYSAELICNKLIDDYKKS